MGTTAMDTTTADELAELRRHRRALHRIPELDFELPRTIAYIEDTLAPLSCEVTHPCRGCVCAFFDAGTAARQTTAIRADMDALPIEEATGAAFASEHPGRMHACGHDAHMAMALTMATYVDRTLREHPGELQRNVLFVFQPAEETTGGAKVVCDSGVFERYGVDRIFGFHVWPDLPQGTVASCAGPMLARSSETHARIHGKSVHIAKTYGVSDADSHDAALAAARFVLAERELMARLGAEEPCICKFGIVEAGSVCNAVAGEAHISGSLRVFSDAMFERAKAEIERVLREACEATSCTYELGFATGYPPVDNDPELFGLARQALPGLQLVEEPLLIAEDFAFYQRHLPGVFFLLGTGVPQDDGGEPAANPCDAEGCPAYATSALHADTMLFDERALLTGLDVYRRLLGLS